MREIWHKRVQGLTAQKFFLIFIFDKLTVNHTGVRFLATACQRVLRNNVFVLV